MELRYMAGLCIDGHNMHCFLFSTICFFFLGKTGPSCRLYRQLYWRRDFRFVHFQQRLEGGGSKMAFFDSSTVCPEFSNLADKFTITTS